MARRPEQAVTTGVARPWLRDGLSNAGPIAIAGLVANGGSLVVTVALARLLAARDYGALNQLIGVFFVVSTPGTAVLVAVVRRVTAWDPCRDGVLAQWVARLHRTGGVVLFGFAACVGAAGPAIAGLLGRGDPLGIDAAAVAGALWVLLCVDRGLIQSRRRYLALAGNLLVEGSLRTVLMVAFGAAGLGARGVAVGSSPQRRSRPRTHVSWRAGRRGNGPRPPATRRSRARRRSPPWSGPGDSAGATSPPRASRSGPSRSCSTSTSSCW